MEYATILDYLTFCEKTKRLSPHTIRAYKNDLTHFYLDYNQDVTKYLDYLYCRYSKSSTLKRKIASLKAFYRYLEEQHIINENPFHHKRFHFKSEKILPKTIPLLDLKKLFYYLQYQSETAQTSYATQKACRQQLIFSLLLSTGLRISELCQLQKASIDLSNRTILILGKGKKERLIFLGDEQTVTLLAHYLQQYGDNGSAFLFPGNDGKEPITEQSIRLLLKRLVAKLELSKHITPHMFRHTFATMLLDDNVDIRHIQHLLGHSSIAVTQIYTHVSQNKQQEILAKQNPIFSIFKD